MTKPNIIARAFELASESLTIQEVRHKLKLEGYDQIDAHLSGRHIRGQLNERLIGDGRKRRVR